MDKVLKDSLESIDEIRVELRFTIDEVSFLRTVMFKSEELKRILNEKKHPSRG